MGRFPTAFAAGRDSEVYENLLRAKAVAELLNGIDFGIGVKRQPREREMYAVVHRV
jgi:hypothetical protein